MNEKKLLRVFISSVSFVLSLIAFKMVLIFFWGITFFPYMGEWLEKIRGLIVSTGFVSGFLAGIYVYRKAYGYLEKELADRL
ncbi:hypothetical protein DENIS_0894 [Desulfonema ishimotonii]|uniref:Uncharacterized protein n=1 Tax=Desulfonema ishimotonii TaxID=45657 RepID=A0A401FSK0_9BACT|nr:hypothetical protein DENIS_0894 [Desulfonema ishimotonii]